ncbi:MAG TPA: multicopper oxidase domain-containing protein [Candidatus Limnocylindrales bacterium]|nr:multicopper oxidase domain-containing protein [Candidatus Limnocylindrales bacterium]
MNRRNRSVTTVLVLVLVLGLALAGCAPAAGAPTWTYAPVATASANAEPAMQMSSAPAPPPATAGGGIPAGGEITIKAFDLGFEPNAIQVAAAGSYPVMFTNTGSAVHDVTFADGTKLTAQPGATVHGTVAVPAAGITFLCSIPGHSAAGMTGTVTVSGAPAASGPPTTSGGTAAAPVEDPNAPPYVLRDPTAPKVLAGTVHDIDLPIVETDITVAKGFVVHAWTFGGTVPGPTIRVHLGDTVRVHLKNEGTMTHSIDFHASQTAMNHQMVEIQPGATFTYTFTADYAGVWMYHCGTPPALHHIANGMFGMVIVEPKGGLPEVDEEFAFVQSEWYLGAQKEPVDYAKANAAAPAPDFVVFNGIAAQYKDNPIQVTTKGRVRVFVLDAGPNVDSSFHVVGTIFDSVVKEGVSLSRGDAGGWGSQAVDLAPAQGAIIEFSPGEDGMYPMVTHAFNFVGRGAIGIFMAGDGDPLK